MSELNLVVASEGRILSVVLLICFAAPTWKGEVARLAAFWSACVTSTQEYAVTHVRWLERFVLLFRQAFGLTQRPLCFSLLLCDVWRGEPNPEGEAMTGSWVFTSRRLTVSPCTLRPVEHLVCQTILGPQVQRLGYSFGLGLMCTWISVQGCGPSCLSIWKAPVLGFYSFVC